MGAEEWIENIYCVKIAELLKRGDDLLFFSVQDAAPAEGAYRAPLAVNVPGFPMADFQPTLHAGFGDERRQALENQVVEWMGRADFERLPLAPRSCG